MTDSALSLSECMPRPLRRRVKGAAERFRRAAAAIVADLAAAGVVGHVHAFGHVVAQRAEGVGFGALAVASRIIAQVVLHHWRALVPRIAQ